MRRNDFAMFCIGFSSILSQILLVREFLVSFYGNELSIGIIFAAWMVWIGIGSVFGNRIIKQSKSIFRLYVLLLAITPLVTCAQILTVKFVRVLLHTTTGEFLSMAELIGFSFTVLSIGCFLWGMLFVLGAQSLASEKEELWLGVNKAYVLESLGSVAGGLVFSFILTSMLTTFQIVALMVLVAWNISSWLALPFQENLIVVQELLSLSLTAKVRQFVVTRRKKFAPVIISVVTALSFVLLLNPIRSLEQKIDKYQWSFINNKLTFIHSFNTKYQNLSLLSLENQHTVYSDGRPVYNIPNTYDAEVFTHSVMIHRVNAKRVLIIGGGFNGILKEILKYPVQEIEYLEIDPALLPLVEPILDKQNQTALKDTRVKILSGDGREYLRQAGKSFDVILLNVGEPSTASLNRFFTLEFYRQCASRLETNGILAFSFPSSAEYLVDELKDLNASVYHTLKRVFHTVLIIPGDHAILIGSKSTYQLASQSDSLALRYRTAGISSEYFSEYMYEALMLPERISSITHTLESAQNYRLNTDSNPVTYFFDLLLWNRFLQGDNRFFSFITRSRIFIAEGVGIGFILLLLFLQRKQRERMNRTALGIIIACCGMIGVAMNLLLLLNYQETFGSIYEMIGAMTAANMLGMALGALVIIKLLKQHHPKRLLVFALIMLTAIVYFFPAILNFLFIVHAIPLSLFIMMLMGTLIGILFGIVNKYYLHHSKDIGTMYGADLLGSSLGALIVCSVLLPVLGIHETTLFLALFPLVLLILLPFTLRNNHRLQT